MKCPGCRAAELLPFLEIESIPTSYNVPLRSREAALASPVGSMRLAHCPGCGLIHNTAFDPALLPYEQGYENSLHFSLRFDAFARELAASLIERYDLHGRLILEIGCGRGDFLCMLCEDGNEGLGFDPSYAGTKPERRGAENVAITAEPFAGWRGARPAGLVCCRHTLEHVQEPWRFLEDVRRVVEAAEGGTPVYFEVPNARHLLESDSGAWDLTYEHCSYFPASALEAAFTGAGFAVSEVSEEFEGQFLSLYGTASAGSEPREGTPLHVPPAGEDVERFGERFRRTVSDWDTHLCAWLAEGRKPVVWGGGSKGITFLNSVPAAREIDCVVDINPHKHGLFVPGTGQRFVAPEFLREHRPDLVILMNSIYADEVRRQLNALDLVPAIVTV